MIASYKRLKTFITGYKCVTRRCKALLAIKAAGLQLLQRGELVAGDDIRTLHGVLPPAIGHHGVGGALASLIPHHEMTPVGTGVPAVGDVGKLVALVVVVAIAALGEGNHLRGIGGLNLGELLQVLLGGVAIEVAAHDVDVCVAGIPVGVLIVVVAVAVVVLRGPDPDEVLHALLLEVVEHGGPELLIGLGTVVAPPEPRRGPCGLLLGGGVAGSLVEGAPSGGDASILQLQQGSDDLIHLVVEPTVLP